MTLRLLTYNIRQGGVGRIAALARVIAACGPDIVVLQEATQPHLVADLSRQTGLAEWRSFGRQSLAFLSRRPVADAAWHQPRFSRYAYIEIVPAEHQLRIFGVHLSAMHSAWTERRRVVELQALLRDIARHQHGFHVIAGDFNTLAPDELLDMRRLPMRYRPFVWLSGGRVRWRTIQTAIDAGYVDAYRLRHPDTPGYTLPTHDPHVRLDYVFVPNGFADRVAACDVVTHPDGAAASDHFPIVADLLT